MRKSAALLPLLAATLGCSGLLQSYAGGIQVICDAPSACTECGDASPDMRMNLMANHVAGQLWNSDAIALFEAMAYAAPDQKPLLLRSEAQANGIQKCELADWMESAQRQLWSDAVETVCAMSVTCGQLDLSDPETFTICVEKADLPYEVVDTFEALDTSSSKTLAEEVQRLAAQHGQPACALAAALRNAP